MMPPIIGTAVRFARSNGETSATPAIATIFGAIGEIFRLMPATNCIGSNIITGAIPIFPAISGTRFANEKNAAFPEPIKIAETIMINTITMVIIMGLKPTLLINGYRVTIKSTPKPDALVIKIERNSPTKKHIAMNRYGICLMCINGRVKTRTSDFEAPISCI